MGERHLLWQTEIKPKYKNQKYGVKYNILPNKCNQSFGILNESMSLYASFSG